jgi:putative hydroxymethylpyrimidine transport system permease protein
MNSLFKSSIAAIIGLVTIWQLIVSLTGVPRFILPSPFLVGVSFVENFELIVEHALVTVSEIMLGLTIGITLGIITALQFEMSPAAKFFLKPVLIFSQAIPVFALAPVLTLWLGYGMISKVTMAVLIIYFPVTSALHDGLSRTPSGLSDLAHVMNAKPIRFLFLIRLPAAMPNLLSGIRLAAVYAPIGAVIGEWVGSSQGLGYLMLLANGRVKTDLMFAALFTLGFLSMSLYGLITLLIKLAFRRFEAH